MNIKVSLITIGFIILSSCHHQGGQVESTAELTSAQQKLLDAGWAIKTPNEDLTAEYGIQPKFGIQDNYFDITMGAGYNVVVKIMDSSNDKCIRYIYVAENSTATIHEIPQGVYYLKLAYGYDWMELESDGGKLGKFTRNVLYERSQDTFDFGVKNSREEVNYRLEINVVNSKLENNFLTTPIDENEFMK